MDPLQGMIRTESCGPNANQKIVGMVYDVRKRGSVNWGMVISGSQCGNGLYRSKLEMWQFGVRFMIGFKFDGVLWSHSSDFWGPTLAQSLNPNLVAEQLSSTEIQPFYNDIKPKK